MDATARACKLYSWPKYLPVDMDDVDMAYKCLSNPSKREEYDEYLTSHTKMAGYQRRFYRDFEEEEEDSDQEKYAKKRSEDRGKRRYEEKDEFFNDSFMNNFSHRRRSGTYEPEGEQTNNSSEAFNKKGKELKIEVRISFQESIKGATKGILMERMIKWAAWSGTRSAKKNDNSHWYSWDGVGTK